MKIKISNHLKKQRWKKLHLFAQKKLKICEKSQAKSKNFDENRIEAIQQSTVINIKFNGFCLWFGLG